MRDFIHTVVEKLNVGENNDRVSVAQYSGDAEANFYLNTYNTKEDILDMVSGLRHKGGRPVNTGAALQYVRDNVFTASSGSRRQEGVPQLLILVNGGRSSDTVDTPASALKQLGITVLGIGTRNSDHGQLQKISSKPNYALSVSDFSDLPNIQEQLSSAISTVTVRATPMTPTVIVEHSLPKRDVVFLLDGSHGTRTGFPAMRDFVQKVVETLNVDGDRDRVSVVQYSSDPAVQFYLNTYKTQGDVVANVRGLRHKGGSPLNTGAALQYLRDNVFTASAGSRRLEGVPQMLIVLCGGKSYDSVDAAATALKELGVFTLAIGTSGSDSRELQKISHGPNKALSVSDFTDLPSVQQQLQTSMESVVIVVTPESPTVLVDHEVAGKDVVFLLDGSDNTRNGFAAMRDFVQRMVEQLNVGENNDRVSVVQYGRDAEAHFYLNTYTTKDDILDTVRGLRHRGGRPLNTGSALKYVRDNVFTAASGSRRQEGIPQLLIVLSGGRSSDNVDIPASALKDNGVLILGIGTRNSSTEVQRIASDPSYAQSVSDFSDLPNVQHPFASSLSHVVVGVKPMTPTVRVDQRTPKRDVVFLLDGSDGTRNGFPAMRDFIHTVVEKLNVGENNDRVSVAQYSGDAEANFYLNTYNTKEDILDMVSGLRHKGGRPVNTGAALQYVRDNVFTASSGSRRQEGVPQLLILVNGGRSSDTVDTPASALKQLGITVLGIGTRNSDHGQLQKISSKPNYALSVSDFSDLPNIQEQLSSAISTVTVRATPMTPTVIVEHSLPKRDVVFLLDGSHGTRTGFPAMRDFVQKVVETLNVDGDRDRVSVVQYSSDPAVQFYLNTYKTQGDVVANVRGLRHKGGSPLNTGAALQYLRDNVFTASAGSRRLEGVPQMLIVLCGGKSYDSVDAAATALKELGVFTLAIGTSGSDSRELQKISHGPNKALSVSDFTDLPSVQQQLQTSMESVVIVVTPESPTVLVDHEVAGKDVVFLLDGSDNTRNGFAAMRDFVQRMVEQLNVGENNDRVSVVQYGRDAEAHFYLNTYTTKDDILDTVRGLRHRGGRPLNTGSALKYVRDNVFTAASGSRRQEGIPQLLIVLSGGRSSDNVDIPASALKDNGVLILGIGTRNSSTEVQRIASDPSYAQSVSDFSDLPNVQHPFASSLSHVVVGVKPMTPTVRVDQRTPKRDVVFLLDGSDGTRNGFPAMRDFIHTVVEKLNVGENNDRVSVAQYSGDAEANFYLNTYNTKEDILDMVSGLRHKGGRPVNTGAALQYVRDNVFTASSGSRRQEGVPQLLILVNGGRSSDTVDTPASALKQLGITVLGIGTRNSDHGQLQKISSKPNYALSVSDFSDLPNIQEQLSSAISTVTVRATPMTPTVIVEHSLPKRDVVFLLDGSHGTRTGFPAMRDFVQKVVETLNVDGDRDRVSVVQYSSDPAVQFYLNTYKTQGDVVANVRGLRHKGGSPLNTGAALQYLRDNVFTASAGSRRLEGVPQMLIVLCGGKSYDSVDAAATALKELGVFTLAIGTSGSDSRELQKISHGPNKALSVSDFTDLPSVQQQLQTSMESVVIVVTPESPTVLVDHEVAGKDVVFLLDGSDNTRNGFAAMRDFVQRMVEQLNVGENNDRVSVVQYGRDAEAHFYLNTYTTKDDILDTVRGLRHRGGRPLNTGSALKYVRDNVFTAASGSRRQEGIPQLLIVLSGGRSSDNVDIPASALKDNGVLILGIGTRNSSTEVQRIASDPSYAQSVSDFSDLPNVQHPFASSLSHVVVGVKPMTPTVRVDQRTPKRDVVFLLDGSDGTRNGFPAMRDFIHTVVEKLNVGENNDRVSVAQYSGDAEANFYLNTYNTKEDILDMVSGLRHKGGRPVNTGAALQYVRDNVFTASSGSRRQEGVPQLLILVNGGRSSDTVDTPASALKQLGITVLGIGTRNSDHGQLQKISSKPNYALSVSDFSDLPNIQEQLSSAISTVTVRATPMTPTVIVEHSLPKRDVVFLLDGSHGTRTGFPAMRDFVQKVVETLNVDGDRDRVSVVQYSSDPAVQFYLNTYKTQGDVVANVRGLRHKGGSPLNTGAALQYLRDNVFTASAGSRRLEGVPQMLIVLCGGKSYDSVDAAATALKELGVFTLAIGTSGSDSRELQKISHGPNKALSVSDFTDLPSVQQQLQTSMESVVIVVTPESPTVLVDHEVAGKDVVFLLDGSDNTRNGFAAMRDFVQRMVEQLNVGENNDRVSVVQYGRDAEAHFYLNTYTTKDDILDTVRGLRHRGGRPLNTGSALKYVRDNVFTAASGSRRQEGIPQLLIVLSGGRSSDNVDIPASALKDNGVLILGIGTRNSSTEVQRIASDPSYAQSVSDFSDLPNVQHPFASSLSHVVVGVKPMTPTVRVDQRTPKRDVVFLLDGSDGTRNGFPAMRDFIHTVVEKLNVGENNDRVSVAQYSGDAEANFYLNTYNTKEDILDMVSGLRHKGGRPVNTGAALQYVRDNVFTASSGSRRQEGVPQLLILVNGGRSSDTVDTPASALKQLGITVLGIGTRNSDHGQLQKISSKPNYALSVSDFSDLPNIQEQLSSAISTVTVRATPMTPTVIVEHSLPKRDVVFLLDGSHGTRTGFPAMRDFVQKVVETLNVDGDRDRVSVVQYSSDPAVQFYLNTYKTQGDVVANVRGLRHKGGSPLNTGAALQYLRDNVFTASAGSRRLEGVPQMLIVLCGGKSYDSVDAAATALKELGVFTLAIGTSGSDSRELQKISHGPNKALSVSDFTDLPSVQQQLQTSMESVVIVVTPESPTVLVDHEVAGKDVVFLLDGSDNTRNGFAAMRDFVQRMVEQLNVGENNDRVSVVQYGRDAEAHFYLNTYTTKDDILDTVRGLRHRGGRPLNTGSALKYVRDNVFTAASGSRRQEGIPQLLIVLSGGRSSDNVDIPASALKDNGVLILGIGTRNSSTEVQRIASDPSYAQSVSDFSDLPNVQHPFASSLSHVVVGVKPMTPTVRVDQRTPKRDVVFLLDGSDGTRNGFPAMRDFIHTVVEKLNVGENNDRVSVAQYSGDAEANFYLNTYNTKEDILDMVSGLRHKGGRPVNTGAALQYVRDNVFTASSGSRRQEGVPQLLILVNGGRSSDTVDTPASALKQLGITVLGIGTRNSDHGQLQKISSKPNYALSVSDFSDLPNIQEQLSSAISTVTVRATPMTPTVIVEHSLPKRDVVFLLDGSHGTRTGFPAMRDFVQKVVETLNVDGDRDRVSVVQYSSDPAVQFYLNTYKTQGDVVANVRGLRHKGGSPLNTGAALQYLRDNVFTASAGSRRLEGVPQMLIVLCGGKSYDSVDAAATALKELGVFTLAIGTSGSDSRELQKISHGPNKALSVSDFTDLPSVQQQLQTSMESVVIVVTPESPTVLVDHEVAGKDVVFLLDGSDNTRNGFAAMRDFVQRMVEQLNVGENNDRVSVVQYGRDAEAHFYLNTYTTKDDILDTVRGLRHRGGRPLNTGSALKYVRDNVFTAASGSRRQEGIPQLLIVLSGGRSSDNVDIPASALKDNGVLILGIGTRNSSTEVQRIASDPSYAQSVSDFSDLPNVQHPFASSLSHVVVGVKPMTPTVRVDQRTPKRDVVFLLDGSDGTRNGFPAMRDFIHTVVEKLNVGENNDRVSVAQYSGDAEANFYLNTYNTKEDILDMVSGLRHKGGRPVNTGAALQYVRDNVFTASSGSRRQEGVPQLLILVNGGRSSDTVDTPASALKQLGITVLGIGTRNSDHGQLQKISSKPNYALSVSDFSDLPNIQEQLSSAISTVTVRATPMTPTVIVEHSLPKRDVVFLLDGSHGTRTGFPAMRDFVQKVVETLNVDGDRDRVSVVQYSSDPAVQFYLNTYKTQGDVVANVRGLRHKGGSPLNTGAALQYLRDNVFTASAGSRRLEGVPQMLIVLCGGKSYDSVDAAATALKELGVFTLAIGTSGSDSRELQKISHGPNKALSVSDFTDLPSVQQQLQTSMESVVIVVTPESPTVLVDHEVAGKDVVFLLDGSDNTRNGFAAMRDFVQRMVEQLNVGENNDRVSVVQYGRDAEAHFYLNTYTTKDDILDTVRGLRHRGGRPLNTGSALKYVRDNVFTAASGSRRQEGIPQLLIVLSGGRSSDNVDIPASALKDNGVLILGIGTRNSSTEVQRIASDPSYAQSVSDFSDLPNVQHPFASSLSHVVVGVKPMTPTVRVDQRTPKRDVVFLLDGSDGTRNGFPAMRDFIHTVVEKLNVGENNDRVSVAQYSGDAEANFYLNTYNTKEDILDMVSGLRHKGGRPVNTGAALQYVRDNVFTASSGSRRQEGVPQLLILVNGGRSSDTVDTPASALKQLGITVLGIGTRNSDHGQLQKISSKPNYALSVSDFSDLPNIQEQLSSAISTVTVRATPMTPTVIVEHSLPKRDVVFLLDGSHGTRTGFPAMRDFVQKVVETLNVDGDRDRVSVVQYSSDPAVQFYLNTYKTQGDVVANVRGLRHKGGRPLNTGAALQYLRDNVFTASAGSRRLEGVPQMLIVLCGGKSYDSVDAAATALKELGVFTLAIGTSGSDSGELQKISHGPNKALSVSDFTDLPSVQQQLQSSMESVVIVVTPESPTVLGMFPRVAICSGVILNDVF
ncbi:uncharacterized protein LOC132475786 isoform X1 [Gadus macrocephalus]|uniref:uncharacterized protein LOC132475786 isoform X1 n=2 Tax=Gadus macrocephalus TaxID=80720 RepID=UPI0028CB1359|nr:uncharacterized protein LOC132475786 isoform X1 [Gadus macrocephalus]